MSRAQQVHSKGQSNHSDNVTCTKRWLRGVVVRATRFWAPLLQLDARVDSITLFIAPVDDPVIGDNGGACVIMDKTRRSAHIRIKQNVVYLMQNEYPNVTDPAEVVEMTVLHELNHIITNLISDWVFSTIQSMSSKKVLDSLFEQEEEQVVEHLTRAWFFAFKDNKENSSKKFKGKIIYLSKDLDVASPTVESDD